MTPAAQARAVKDCACFRIRGLMSVCAPFSQVVHALQLRILVDVANAGL